MSNPQQRYSKDVGRVCLFVPNEAQHMNAAELTNVANEAKSVGVDTLVVKRADGTGRWYTSAEQIINEYRAVTNAGCGYIPFTYMYGYGAGQRNNNQVDGECAIALELTNAIANARSGEGFVIVDAEQEYNNQVGAAQRFVNNMNGKPGLLGLTTWANPNQQGWDSVVKTLLPVVNAWIPQAYDNYLDSQLWQDYNLGELNIQPAIDLSGEFGPNDPVAVARNAKQRGATTVYLWTYSLLNANRSAVQQIADIMRG